jgi:hypothetical protein
MLSYFLEKEAAKDIVTGEQMLTSFCDEEESRPTTGSQMLSYFLEKEAAKDIVTGEQMLTSLFFDEEHRQSSIPSGEGILSSLLDEDDSFEANRFTGADMLEYMIEPSTEERISGHDLLDHMLQYQPAPTASPTPAPSESISFVEPVIPSVSDEPTTGFDLLESFIEPVSPTVSKETMFVDFLSSVVENDVDGSDLLKELLSSQTQQREMAARLQQKQFKITGERLLSHLVGQEEQRLDNDLMKLDLIRLLEMKDAEIQQCIDGTSSCNPATSALILRAISRSDSVLLVDKLASFICRAGHKLPICSTVSDLEHGVQPHQKRRLPKTPATRAPILSSSLHVKSV